MADVLDNADADLTPQMRNLMDMPWSEWKLIEQLIAATMDSIMCRNYYRCEYPMVSKRFFRLDKAVLGSGSRSAVFAQAGTACSTRGRGEANSYDVIQLDVSSMDIRTMSAASKGSEPSSVQRYERAAVEHLIELGHRELLYVRNSHKSDGPALRSHQLRDQGFAAAIRSCAVSGLRTHIVDVHGPGADAGEQAIAVASSSFMSFSAVIATTDMVAMGVYRALHARGLRVPEDVSVVGFDNTYFSRFMNPPLTTVDVPRDELSRFVIAALIGPEQSEVLQLPTKLIPRSSTSAPRY